MKKIFVLIALLNLILLTGFSISAQKFNSKINSRIGKSQVKYSNVSASSDGQGVLIEWETEFESKNLGFYVYRIVGGQRERVNESLIAGAYLQMRGGQTSGKKYTLFDAQGDLSASYRVESFGLDGRTYASNEVSAEYIGDPNSETGQMFQSFKKNSKTANPNVLQNEMVLPKDLQVEVEDSAAQADIISQRWVAAQPGVKIGVRREGIYRVSRTELQNAGFNVSAPSALWQLYANGVQQSVIVGNNGDYIEFYGKGIDTRDSDTQIYFLVVGTENGKRIANSFRRGISSPVISNNFLQSFVFKERTSYLSGIFNGDAENYFGRVINNAGATIPLDLPAIDFGAAAVSIDITIQGGTQNAHQTRVVINGVELGTLSGSGTNSMSRHFDIPTSVLQPGVNNLQLNTLSGSSDISFFDTVKINYARKYVAEQNRLSFYTPNYRAVYVEGFTSPNIRVFDITSPDTPSLIANLQVQQSAGGYRVYLPSNRGRVMYAVEDSAIRQVASIVPNAPSTLSTAAHSAEFVIISYRDWMTEANTWANYRRARGLTVEVVNVEDIYDEFGYGVFGADAIKSFLQYAKGNWQTPPNYAFLLGDATYDPRNYTGAGENNFVPTKMVETVYLETGSDDALVDFDDDGLTEMAIGRIPAQNGQDVTLALNKVTKFEQQVPQNYYTKGFLFVSDLPIGYDFEAVSNRLSNLIPSSVPRTMVNRSQTNATSVILDEMNRGKYLVNFTGHGNTGAWTSGNIFNKTYAAQLTNTDNLTIFSMLTCLNGYFIQPSDSISEVLLKNPNGGAVAAWASTGETTPDIQEIMAMRFFTQLAAGNITRLGDLVKDAKTAINYGRDVRLSWALLGDPALKVR